MQVKKEVLKQIEEYRIPRLFYRLLQRTFQLYRTPYGALDMGIYATHVKYNVDQQQTGEVNLKYQLDLQGQFAAIHELRIRFCPAQKA